MSRTHRSTERLSAKVPCGDDELSYHELLLSPEINRWLRPPPLRPLMDPDPGLWLARDIEHWREHEFGPWVLSDRRSGAFRGRAGLSYTTLQGLRVVELSWAISPARWREGLASETALLALGFARELGVSRVIALTLTSNLASIGVMEKIGMTPAGETTHAGLPHLLYLAELKPRASGDG